MNGYLIVLQDITSDIVNYGFPEPSQTPLVVYRTEQEAVNAAAAYVRQFPRFRPAAYGEAFPYEHVTLHDVLTEKGVAPVGWIAHHEDDDGTYTYVGVFILRIQIGA